MANSTSVTTVKGRQKLCKAHAGLATLPKIEKMVWGKGGVDSDGTVKTPTGEETDLYDKLLEKNITSVTLVGEDETTAKYTGKLEKTELAGEEISELGLVDTEGDLIVIRTFLPKGKDGDIEMTFDINEIF